MAHKQDSLLWIAGSLGALIVAASLYWLLPLLKSTPAPSGPPLRVVMALPNQQAATAVFVAQAKGYFRDQNIELVEQRFDLGMQALKSMVDGHADLAINADTPFMLSVLRGAPVSVVAVIYDSRDDLAIIGLKAHGINTAEDLIGKTIGVPYGTSAQFFLDAYLVAHRIPRDKITIVDVRPDQFANRLQDGSVDALSLFTTWLTEATQRYGDQLTVLQGLDLFTNRFIVTAKQDYLATHQEDVSRVLKAMSQAENDIRADPADALRITAKALQVPETKLSRLFDSRDYKMMLDQALLLSLDDQSRWALKKGLVEPRSLPDYSHYIDVRPLMAVNPDAVRVIY